MLHASRGAGSLLLSIPTIIWQECCGCAGRIQSPLSVRFHHLHYRVADPGHALGEAAEMFGGNRTILQGIGVGVRVGREYVLFERDRGGELGRAARPAACRYLSGGGGLAGQERNTRDSVAIARHECGGAIS